MKKFKWVMFLLIVALLTMGQEGCQSSDKGKNKVNPYIGGTRGLSVQFAEGAPPDEVFDNKQFPFDIDVKLLNVGERDIAKEDVKVTISGLNPADFGKTDSFFIRNGIDEDILATYKDFEGNIISPSEIYITFPGLNFQDILTGNFQLKSRADVCYGYATEAVADGCIRADVLSVDTDAVCIVNEEKTVYNTGAPIQVIKFVEQPSGTDKIRYLFTIKHVGSGRVYIPDSKCPTTRGSEDRLYFKVDSSVSDLTCSGLVGTTGKEGEVILRNGEQVVRCVQQTKSQLDYIDRIKITLTYDYEESFDQPILVKKSN
ncbi:MAG: hypothetical protein AABW92_01490 [Nanoarchaeota archaeon]